jgi:type IV secretion system protein VirB5
MAHSALQRGLAGLSPEQTDAGGDLETPYRRARQEWDERLGTSRRQTFRWQLAFGAMFIVSAIAVFFLGTQIGKSHVAVHVVDIDTGGQVLRVMPAPQYYQPTKAQLAWQAKTFITAIRSLPVDPVVARRQWFQAFGVTTDRARQMLATMARENDVLKDVGQRAVQVEITRCIPRSELTYDVQWVEAYYDQNFVPSGPKRTYSGMVTMVLQQPKNEKEVVENPLGVWVDYFSWSEK